MLLRVPWVVGGAGLPAHVERDLRSYLECGILARGFAEDLAQPWIGTDGLPED